MKKETTIEYLGTLLTVSGEYEPAEKEVRYYGDMSGQPASPAQFEITKVLTESGDNIFGIFYEEQLYELEELALINLEE